MNPDKPNFAAYLVGGPLGGKLIPGPAGAPLYHDAHSRTERYASTGDSLVHAGIKVYEYVYQTRASEDDPWINPVPAP